VRGKREREEMAAAIALESSNPNADAEDVLRLLPNQFRMEEFSDGKELVVLVPRADSCGGTVIFLVPKDSKLSTAASATLVVSQEDVDAVLKNNSSNDVSALKGDNFTGAVIRIRGGSSMLLFPISILSSTRGRQTLAHFTTATEWSKYLTKDDNDGSFAVVPLVNDYDATGDDDDGKVVIQQMSQLPKFPSLSVSILQQNDQMTSDFPLNSPVGIPFETDLFTGEAVFITRPIDPKTDPYYYERIFSKKKRRVILQIQGKFKRVPTGTLYAGGEISDPMKLGLFTKGLSNLLLKFVKSFASDLHYSFGDAAGIEKAHIAVPALQFFDSIIFTKPGEIPPPISEIFVESNESIKARMNNTNEENWNTTDIISLGFNTMYLDVPTWRVVSIPLTRDLDLRQFWGKSLFSMVLYETETDTKRRHVCKNNQYFFKIQFEFIGLNATESDKEIEDEDENILPWDKPTKLRHSSLVRRPLSRAHSNDSFIFHIESEDGEEDDSFLNATDTNVGFPIDEGDDEDKVDSEYFDTLQSLKVSMDPLELSLKLDNNMPLVDEMCPARVDIISSSKGKHTTVYAFNIGDNATIYRTSSQFARCNFDKDNSIRSIEATCSPRMSSQERKRRIMGHVISTTYKSDLIKQKIQSFVDWTKFESTFLQKDASTLLSSRKKIGAIYTSNIARALSEYHWVEEIATLTDRYITFYQPPKYKQPSHRIIRSNVVKVRKLSKVEGPQFPQHYFMAVETIGRTAYLMFASEDELNSWMEALSEQWPPQLAKLSLGDNESAQSQKKGLSKGISPQTLFLVDDPTEEFLHKSSIWSCKQRRILNCRQFSFNYLSSVQIDPSILIADALCRALDPELGEESEVDKLQLFLNTVSALKDVNVNQLPEKERLAFFLNLYHVMIMHAFLVVGLPSTAFQWKSYFNMISYQCSDDIFSLAELEHCIIRGSMEHPTVFASKLVIPKSQYNFVSPQADYRINFALNCGSLSTPGCVPIYNGNSLEKQLDDSTTAYLEQAIKVKKKSNNSLVVYLPRVCLWYADDFGNGSAKDVLRLIQFEKYLNDQEQKVMSSSIKGDGITVKYLPFNFQCRNLYLVEEK